MSEFEMNVVKRMEEARLYSKCYLCIAYDFGREENWCHECCVDEACTKEHSDFAD